MKNVSFGEMRRVQHHVLALVESTFARCLARVTICASNFALCDLLQDHGPAERPAHVGDIHSFVAEVVELKHNRVGLAAVHAWMQREVLPNPQLVLASVTAVDDLTRAR